MAKRYYAYPPLEKKSARIRRRMLRWFVNVLVLIGMAVLYYILFSFLFDTPAEYREKQKSALLKNEYRELVKRLNEVEQVLDNVVERDHNVFQIMFEAEPYEANTFEVSRWATAENMPLKTNNELNDILLKKTGELEYSLDRLNHISEKIHTSLDGLKNGKNNIPAIQPVINKDLTLLTASFGMRIHPFYKSLSQHNGVDFTVPEGSRVFVTADGRVKETILRRSSSGLSVVIDHGNGYESVYSHLGKVLVKKGQTVSRGDIIALSGNTGLSLVPHLHYEIRHKGQAIDPVNYFFMELSPQEYQRMIGIARSGMQSFD